MIPSDLKTLPPTTQALIAHAQSYIGVCEDPVGSNRSPDIDAWNAEFGSPLGSYWCGNFVGHCAAHIGEVVPPLSGSCDEWVYWAKQNGLWSLTPAPGAKIIYTNGKLIKTGRYAGQLNAVHIGIVVRVKPLLQTIEGNTTTGGFERNGHTVALKEPDVTHIYGYALPRIR